MGQLKSLAKYLLWALLPFHKADSWPLTVKSGPAAGTKLILDLRVNGAYWLGRYDGWILDRLKVGQFLRPGGVAWDCGAYVGYYSAIFRKTVGDGGKVEVFEASSCNYERLKMLPKVNGWDNVSVHHLAVGPDHTEIEFAGELGGSSGPAAMSKTFVGKINTERVGCCGVDELIEERGVPVPDFIKFDLETAEEFALHNGQHLFSAKRPVLLLELHGRAVFPAVARFFESFGYQGWNILEFQDTEARPCP